MAILAWIVALWFGLAGAVLAALAVLLCAAQYAVLARKRLLYVSGSLSAAWPSPSRYFATVMVWTGIAVAFRRATVLTGVGAIATGALLVAGPWVWRSMRIDVRVREVYLREPGVLRYVGGALITSLSGSTALQSIYWVGALTAGVAVIGQIKLIEQIVLPYSQLLLMLSLPDQVQSARDYAQLNGRRVIDRMHRRTRHFVSGAGMYCMAAVAATAIWQHVPARHHASFLRTAVRGLSGVASGCIPSAHGTQGVSSTVGQCGRVLDHGCVRTDRRADFSAGYGHRTGRAAGVCVGAQSACAARWH